MRYALNSADTAFATMIAPVTTASGGGRHTPTEAHHGTGSEPSPDATRHFVELAQEACFERGAFRRSPKLGQRTALESRGGERIGQACDTIKVMPLLNLECPRRWPLGSDESEKEHSALSHSHLFIEP